MSIRSKSSLAAIRILENCIVLETMYYPDEIRPVNQVPNLNSAAINEKELQMAQLLIKHLSSDFEPAKYQDDYRLQMMDLIQMKIKGEQVHLEPTQNHSTVLDLMAALQASLEMYQTTTESKKTAKKIRKKKSNANSKIEETA